MARSARRQRLRIDDTVEIDDVTFHGVVVYADVERRDRASYTGLIEVVIGRLSRVVLVVLAGRPSAPGDS